MMDVVLYLTTYRVLCGRRCIYLALCDGMACDGWLDGQSEVRFS